MPAPVTAPPPAAPFDHTGPTPAPAAPIDHTAPMPAPAAPIDPNATPIQAPAMAATAAPALDPPVQVLAAPSIPDHVPADGGHAGGSGPPDMFDPADAAPARRPRKRRRGAKLVLGLLVLAALGAAAWFGLEQFSGDPSDTSDPAAAPAPAESPTGDEGSATVFDETQELVDGINDRPELDEALDSLGLDAGGRPVVPPAGDTGAPSPAEVGGYTFEWVDPSGLSVTVEVDGATGDYAAITGDGTEIRRIGDRYAGRAGTGAWVELSPSTVSGIPVIGTDGLLWFEDVIPAAIEPYVVARDDSVETQLRVLVDDATLAASDDALRTAWLGPWGLLAEQPAPAPVAVVDPSTVPDDATDGQVVVTMDLAADGSVTHVALSSPAIGGTVTYTRSATSPDPTTIAVPDVLTGG